MHSPPAHVYEYNLDLNTGSNKEKGKNMENVKNTEMAAAAMLSLDQMEERPYTDEEFEALLAKSDVKQDIEDVEPETLEADESTDR